MAIYYYVTMYNITVFNYYLRKISSQLELCDYAAVWSRKLSGVSGDSPVLPDPPHLLLRNYSL
jgi:hypothetical protein